MGKRRPQAGYDQALGVALQRVYPGAFLPEPTARIPVGLAHAFLHRVVESIDPAIGLRAGESFALGDCGALDYAIQTAANVREALSTLARYIGLLNGNLFVHLSVQAGQGGQAGQARLNLRTSLDHPAAEDLLMAGLHTVHMRRLLPPGAKLTCHFRQTHPPHELHRRVFAHAALEFGSETGGFTFDANLLDRPLEGADPKLYRVLERQLERDLRELPEAKTYAELLQRLWMRESPMRSTTLANAAAALGMSARTLSRRLASEHVTFGALLDRTRHQRALVCLQQERDSLPAIARELGFSKASAFQRAFHRWTGTTPSAARKG